MTKHFTTDIDAHEADGWTDAGPVTLRGSFACAPNEAADNLSKVERDEIQTWLKTPMAPPIARTMGEDSWLIVDALDGNALILSEIADRNAPVLLVVANRQDENQPVTCVSLNPSQLSVGDALERDDFTYCEMSRSGMAGFMADSAMDLCEFWYWSTRERSVAAFDVKLEWPMDPKRADLSFYAET